MHSDLKIVDPIWTTAYMSRNYGYMVYDTLFAMNSKGEVKPQMVDMHTVAADGLSIDFKLRDGLMFHDGAPVTSNDVIASIKRWGAKDAMGQKMTCVKEMKATGDSTFTFMLNGQPVWSFKRSANHRPMCRSSCLRVSLQRRRVSKSLSTLVPALRVPERRVETGDKAEFAKFEKYVPRSEPGDGLTGGKVVHVDKVVWKVIRDQQTKMNALSKGEIDVIESPSHDLLPLMDKDPNIKLVDLNPFGFQYTFRYNHLHPPFDNPKIRAALLYAFSQKTSCKRLSATRPTTSSAKRCSSAAHRWQASFEDKFESNFKKAREMIKEAGYDGTPVVLMHSADLAVLANLAPVAKSHGKGWPQGRHVHGLANLVARRNKQDKPNEGGWNAFIPGMGW